MVTNGTPRLGTHIFIDREKLEDLPTSRARQRRRRWSSNAHLSMTATDPANEAPRTVGERWERASNRATPTRLAPPGRPPLRRELRTVASQTKRNFTPGPGRRHRFTDTGSQDTEVGHPIATPSLAGQFNRVDPGD